MSRTNKRLASSWASVGVPCRAHGRTFYVQVIAAPAAGEADGQSIRTVELAAPAESSTTAAAMCLPCPYRGERIRRPDPIEVPDRPPGVKRRSSSPQTEFWQAEQRFSVRGTSPGKIDPAVGDKVRSWTSRASGCAPKRSACTKGASPALLASWRRRGHGLAGLELQYEDVLAGEPGELQVVSMSGNRLGTISVKEAEPECAVRHHVHRRRYPV